MELKLNILPKAQKKLWRELGDTPKNFVLYGGTALALRLGHRQSVDFDFFTSEHFIPDELYQKIDYLSDSEIIQIEKNTLTCIVVRNNMPVKVSFFGGLSFKHIQKPDELRNPELRIASLPDLTAAKMFAIQQRAEQKDYLDIAEILKFITLAEAVSYASRFYGKRFNPFLSLKALTYYNDGDLDKLPQKIKDFLTQTVQSEDITKYE